MALKIDKFNSDRFILPPGLYHVQVTNLYEKKAYNNFIHQDEEYIQIELTAISGPCRDKIAFARVTPKLRPSSILWSFMEATMGKPLTGEIVAGINNIDDIAALTMNQTVQVLIKNTTTNKGFVYYKVTEYIPSDKIPDLDLIPKETLPEQPLTEEPVPNHVMPVADVPFTPQPPEEENTIAAQVETTDPTDNWLQNEPSNPVTVEKAEPK